MKAGTLTIAVGLKELLDRAKHHREQADKFDRLAVAFREAERLLVSSNGKPKGQRGPRPDDAARKAILKALKKMPTTFTDGALRKAAQAIDPRIKKDKFRRRLSELCAEGMATPLTKAIGRRQGTYAKNKQTA